MGLDEGLVIILQSNLNTKYLALCCEIGQISHAMALIPNPALALLKMSI